VAVKGTAAVILPVLEAEGLASTPLNLITLSVGVVLKLVPEMVTMAPTAPLAGVNPVMVGVGNRVKESVLVTVMPLEVTEMAPSVRPEGTVAVMLVAEEAVTTAAVPLKLTKGEVPKLFPIIITEAPTAALAGEKEEIEGMPNTMKFVALMAV
jgi:hypothetical protein